MGHYHDTVMTKVVRNFYPACQDFIVESAAVKIPKYATVIMFYGMFLRLLTGKALKHFIGHPANGQKDDFYTARKVINGLDYAAEIQGCTPKFQKTLDLAAAKVMATIA